MMSIVGVKHHVDVRALPIGFGGACVFGAVVPGGSNGPGMCGDFPVVAQIDGGDDLWQNHIAAAAR